MGKMKICFKRSACKNPNPQPLENFYKHSQMGDGHLNKCILCTKFEAEERRQHLTATDPKWVEREAERQRQKEKRRYYKIKHTPEFKEKHRKSNAAYFLRYPERKKAVCAANNALRDGRLERKTSCERCGISGIRLEKHHADYSKPLEVEWLCRKCHNAETWK